jgi:hypothetical protein
MSGRGNTCRGRRSFDPIVSMSFSDDGRQLAVTALDGESKLVQIRRGQQVLIGSLSTGGCRPTAFDLVNFSPRPDLRAKLSFAAECIPGQPGSEIPSAVRPLDPSEAARVIGPAASDVKAKSDETKLLLTYSKIRSRKKASLVIPQVLPLKIQSRQSRPPNPRYYRKRPWLTRRRRIRSEERELTYSR